MLPSAGAQAQANHIINNAPIRTDNFDSQLNTYYTFDSFVAGEPNKLARTAGIAIAKQPGYTAFNPLFIYGGSGVGKTHLANAIGNQVQLLNPHARVLYVSANTFKLQYQDAAKSNRIPDFLNFYQSVDVLIVDDIQYFAGLKGTQDTFFHIFNYLQQSRKQLILTSDRPPIELKDIEERLSRDTSFVWLERTMDPEDSDRVKDLIKERKWEGLSFVDESRRFYPNGSMAANVLGFVGMDDKGLDGLEMSLDSLIRGGSNKQQILTDARGNPILKSVLTPFKAEKERSVYLTIDQNIQFYAERALDRAMKTTHATGGIIIVMDPKTGEILALGNQPSYDPNHFEKADERQFKNRAVVDIYEPGSTFKPIIAATALSAGTYDTKRVWHDPGVVWASGHPIKNWNEESYGDVRLVDIIKWSINTGFAHVGLLTGGETMTDYAKRFGFGRSTGIELPGEGVGLLFEPKNMRPIDVATMSIGQGIAVTPLQMVQAYSALANGGKMVKPHIIASIKNADGSDYQVTEKEVIGQPITEAVASEVKDMMEKEVSEGGGSNAQVPGYHMAGKTGTAQKIDAEHGGYLKNQYIASFCGFGPTEDPRAICLVVLDTPTGTYYGGQVAAPVFKEAMTQIMRYLAVPTIEDSENHAKPVTPSIETNKPKLPSEAEREFPLPSFYGWSMRDTGEWLTKAGLGFAPKGSGFVDKQSPGAGIYVKKGDTVWVHCSE